MTPPANPAVAIARIEGRLDNLEGKVQDLPDFQQEMRDFVTAARATDAERLRMLSEQEKIQEKHHLANTAKLSEISLKVSQQSLDNEQQSLDVGKRSLAWTIAGVLVGVAALAVGVAAVFVTIYVARHFSTYKPLEIFQQLKDTMVYSASSTQFSTIPPL